MTKGHKKIFFSGIGGSGMSALACFTADRGNVVTGSDRVFDRNPTHPLCRLLRAKGITLVPQDGSGIDSSLDLVVFSTAVEPDRPEVIAAKAVGIPSMTRPEYLAEIVTEFRTIAVAGTSGKSTTAGMLAFLMERLGLKPNFIGGGRVRQFLSAANPGNSLTGDSDRLVIEACESDGTIVNYRPLHSVILNLDLDHHTVAVTAGMFRTLIKNTTGKIFLNADDQNLGKITDREAVTFSIDNPSDHRATDIAHGSFRTDFSLGAVRFALSLPGRHNLYNALSCIAVLSEMEVPLQEIAPVLREFRGIERRFDVHLNDGDRIVIDDYAHNPHKISALMETVGRIRERACYIFQPHGFAPTKMMKDEYIDAFTGGLRGSDYLILLPIFYAGGTAGKDISSEDLAAGIRNKGKAAEVVERREDVLAKIREWETVIVFGARDETLSDFAAEIAAVCSEKLS
ncbi:MAG TPA: Mur ligase domain-containing protein [Thermodesulfovibrionales bacterium]|nr:Mur ligase domain-containing protein [Thermodesulfovibrionales bacterium]